MRRLFWLPFLALMACGNGEQETKREVFGYLVARIGDTDVRVSGVFVVPLVILGIALMFWAIDKA